MNKSFESDWFEGFIVMFQTVCFKKWRLQSEDQNQATDTGWVCWFPPPAEQKTHIYFSCTCSQLKEEVTDGGGDRL